LLVQPTNG